MKKPPGKRSRVNACTIINAGKTRKETVCAACGRKIPGTMARIKRRLENDANILTNDTVPYLLGT